MVASWPVNVAMGYLFGRGRAHILYLSLEAQVLPGHGVVEIERDMLGTHIDYGAAVNMAMLVLHLHRSALDNARVVDTSALISKRAYRYVKHSFFVCLTVTIGRTHPELEIVTGSFSRQILLKTLDQSSTTE